MIGLALWVILGLYVGLLVLVWKKVETGPARIVTLTILLSPVIWVIGESSVGYYKFRQACKAEAGLKVYIENPPQAKRLRLEGSAFSAVNAEGVLRRFPSLQSVEAAAKNVHVLPPAYAVYERGPDGKVVSTLMDKVGKRGGHGETLVFESAPSQAEYMLSEELKYLPYRMHKRQYVLRDKEGRQIATTTYFSYTDTDPDKSLLAMPWGRVAGCGPKRDEADSLIILISPRHN
jgi:hypothetical protein